MEGLLVSVVVPVFESADTLPELYQRLSTALAEEYPRFELLMVDDGSRDRTWPVIQELAASDPRVKGIRLSRNFGQQHAIAAAFDGAEGETIVLMDADLEDRPEDLPLLLRKLESGVDVVYTLKRGGQRGVVRRLTSWIFHQLFARIARVTIPGEIGTLRAFNRKFLNALRQYREYDVFYGSLMFHVGFASTFVTVERNARPYGRSSYGFRTRLALAARTLASYTNFPHQFLLITGGLVFVGSVGYGLVILFQTLVYGIQLPPGFTLIALLLIIFMGITMISLGIIGSYVFLAYEQVLARPRYLISEETGEGSGSQLDRVVRINATRQMEDSDATR